MRRRPGRSHRHAPRAPTLVDVVPRELVGEKQEQLEVYRLYVAVGCEVIWFSQPRATMQTEGIPDLKVYCVRKGLTWWHETKRPVGGKQSVAQARFQYFAERCREHYVIGGWEEAVQAVQAFGLVAPGWRPARLGA